MGVVNFLLFTLNNAESYCLNVSLLNGFGSKLLLLKILFISHEASLSGAPISLLNIIKYLKKLSVYDIQILIRSEGILEKEFHALAPTNVYYRKVMKKSLRDRIFYNITRGRHRRKIEHKLFKTWRPNLVYSNTVANSELIRISDRYRMPVIVHVRELTKAIKSMEPAVS